MNHSTFNIHFSRSPESPFSPEGRERERLRKMKAAEPIAAGNDAPLETACVTVNAESMEPDAPDMK
jgi:hypothetical protein